MKAIVMDLDNTLYDATAAYQRGEAAALRLGAEILGLSPEVWAEAWNAGKARTKELLKDCAAQHHRLFYIQHALEYLGRSPFDHAEEIYEAYWQAALGGMELFAGVEDFLQQAKANGIKLALCTDMTAAMQYRKIRRLGLDKYLDVLVTSEEAGMEKPAAQMFNLVLDKLGVTANEAIMIGDSLPKDVEGAKKAGLRAVWKTQAPQDYVGEWIDGYTDGKIQRYCGLPSAGEEGGIY